MGKSLRDQRLNYNDILVYDIMQEYVGDRVLILMFHNGDLFLELCKLSIFKEYQKMGRVNIVCYSCILSGHLLGEMISKFSHRYKGIICLEAIEEILGTWRD